MRPLPLLLLFALAPYAGAQEAPGDEGVMLHMVQYQYSPDPLNVTAGETMVLMNFGPADQSLPRDQWAEFTHSVTAVDGSFDVQNIPPDFQGRTMQAPTTPGTYPYYCRYHGDATSGMRGTLIVLEAPEPTPATPAGPTEEKGTPIGILPIIAAVAAAGALLRGRARR